MNLRRRNGFLLICRRAFGGASAERAREAAIDGEGTGAKQQQGNDTGQVDGGSSKEPTPGLVATNTSPMGMCTLKIATAMVAAMPSAASG